jgi:hypothetical protein
MGRMAGGEDVAHVLAIGDPELEVMELGPLTDEAGAARPFRPRRHLAAQLERLVERDGAELVSFLRRREVKYACLMYTTPDAPGVLPRPEIRIRGGFAASDL